MSDLLLWAGLSAAIWFSAAQSREAQARHVERRCGCACAFVDGTYPWVLEDLAVVLQDGEHIAKRRPWFGGPLVCLDPLEPHVAARFGELQAAVDEGERNRGAR